MWEKHKIKIIVLIIITLFVLVKYDVITANDVKILMRAIVDIVVGFKDFLKEIGIIPS